jgi:hypothetical protein
MDRKTFLAMSPLDRLAMREAMRQHDRAHWLQNNQKLVPLGPALEKRRQVTIFDDFTEYTDGQRWTLFKSAVGGESVAIEASGVNGSMLIQTGGTANNYAGFSTTNKPFQIRDQDPIVFETRIRYTEANTNNAIIAVGFGDSTFHSLMQNGTAGPNANFYGALIYKISGSTVWQVVTSQGATQLLDTSTSASTPLTTDQVLRIELRPVQSGGLLEVNYWIMDLEAINANSQVIPPKPIKHRIAYTMPVNAMAAGIVAIAGGNFNEQVHVDYMAVDQLRGNTTLGP